VKPESEPGFAPETLVPHRSPILGLERITSVSADGASARARIEPGPDVDAQGNLWEQALIEGLAQTASALHAFHARQANQKIVRGMLVGASQLVIHRRARVAECVEYEVELVRQLEAVSLVRGTARVGSEVLAEGELKFYVETVP
jgi:predicted hotdog family 3-hydroxylacyl-ACP dehydratase